MPVFKQNEIFAGRYLLSQLIGAGGFSEVWKVHDLMAEDAIVALKIYAPDQGLDDLSLRQSRNEFALTYPLQHPHLLKITYFDVADGHPFLVMPYCAEGSLTGWLRREGPLNERQLALVMSQIGAALEEIHQQDPPILHQDIKPDNILLQQPDFFMLADFGISSRVRHTLTKTGAEAQALTLSYAPPERFERHPSSSLASDIFSLGVTLYEMCTNSLPWEGGGGQCLLKGAQVPALPATFSSDLSEILEACMSADPARRPTAAAIRASGQRYLETGFWKQPSAKKSDWQLSASKVAAFATAAMVLVALAGFSFYRVQYNTAAAEPPQMSAPVGATANKAAPATAVSLKSKEISQKAAEKKETQKPKARPESSARVSRQEQRVKQPVRVLVKQAETKSQKAETAKPAATKINNSRINPRAIYPKQSSKAKKPLFKANTKKAKKYKPKHKWFKKLKRRLAN